MGQEPSGQVGGCCMVCVRAGALVMVPAGRCPRLFSGLRPLSAVPRCGSGVSCAVRGLALVGCYPASCGALWEPTAGLWRY